MTNAKKPHVHAEVIIAWANGAEIEYYSEKFGWRLADCPQWNEYVQYRVKPVIKKVWVYAQHFEQESKRLDAKIWNEAERNHLDFSTIQVTLTNGKVTAVELLKK